MRCSVFSEGSSIERRQTPLLEEGEKL